MLARKISNFLQGKRYFLCQIKVTIFLRGIFHFKVAVFQSKHGYFLNNILFIHTLRVCLHVLNLNIPRPPPLALVKTKSASSCIYHLHI